MYVTRPLSLYRKDPSALSLPPPEGPNSGILVFEDKNFVRRELSYGSTLPFPQNARLQKYTHRRALIADVILIPVINQPLSSNTYYAITYDEGEACTCFKDKDKIKCCLFFRIAPDSEPKPFDASNGYQQFKVIRDRLRILAKSVASDGHVPSLLRNSYNESAIKFFRNYKLGDALGLDHSLRMQLPDFNFALSDESSDAVIVGKWYSPFMFVKETNVELDAQIGRSMFYEMTLKQQWVRIFSCDRNSVVKGNFVSVDVEVEREVVDIVGMGSHCDKTKVADGVIWFEDFDKEGNKTSVGLCREIVERMKWEQEIFGWVGGKERKVKVKFVEELEEKDGWKKFGCYILIERYVLRRLDLEKSLVLTYEFRHTHQVKCKWE